MSESHSTSSPIVAQVCDATNKKPVLSGKYSKFLSFGYWMSTQLNLSEEDRAQFNAKLRLFSSVEEQTAMFEQFFSEEKTTAKTIKKLIANHNKPPKPVKEKAAKAPRKGKAVVQQDALISQLIADANAEIDVIDNKQEKKNEKAENKGMGAEDKASKVAEKESAKELARLAKEAEKQAAIQAKEDARLAKEAEKQAAIQAKEDARLAKEAEKQAAIQAKEDARLAKEAALQAKVAEKQAKESKKKPAKTTKKPEVVAPVEEPIAAPAPNNPENESVITEENANIVAELEAELIEDEPIAKVVQSITEEVPAPVAESVKEQPKKKTTKAEKPKAEKAEKAKKSKKSKESEKVAEEEDAEIQTRIATIDGADYLIDNDYNIYNLEAPHDHIGVYDQETGKINAV